MRQHYERLGAIPFAFLGGGLLFLGLLSLLHIVNTFWPFDVTRLDLVRATPLGNADAAAQLEAVSLQILISFLASVMVAVTGLVLPLVYYLNDRFNGQTEAPGFLIVLRQSMWIGLWVTFCLWLQMNRTLGLAVAALVAIVLIMFEILLQVRTRAAGVFQ